MDLLRKLTLAAIAVTFTVTLAILANPGVKDNEADEVTPDLVAEHEAIQMIDQETPPTT